MILGLEELHKTSFKAIALPFVWTDGGVDKQVLLKREDDMEVERSNQNIFRGLTSEIQGIKNGDTFKSPHYKDNKELKVITAQQWGDDAAWILITAVDLEDVSYG